MILIIYICKPTKVMSDNLIRCVHENGKVCFLTKAATENRAFMKKYGIRVEHVAKEASRKFEPLEVKIDLAPMQELIDKTKQEMQAYKASEQEAEAVDKQVAESLAEATKPVKPKQTRKPRKPTKR